MLISLQIASTTRIFRYLQWYIIVHIYIENQGRTTPWFNGSVLFIFGKIVNIYTNLRFNDSFLHILDQIGGTWLIMSFSVSIWYIYGKTTNPITLLGTVISIAYSGLNNKCRIMVRQIHLLGFFSLQMTNTIGPVPASVINHYIYFH